MASVFPRPRPPASIVKVKGESAPYPPSSKQEPRGCLGRRRGPREGAAGKGENVPLPPDGSCGWGDAPRWRAGLGRMAGAHPAPRPPLPWPQAEDHFQALRASTRQPCRFRPWLGDKPPPRATATTLARALQSPAAHPAQAGSRSRVPTLTQPGLAPTLTQLPADRAHANQIGRPHWDLCSNPLHLTQSHTPPVRAWAPLAVTPASEPPLMHRGCSLSCAQGPP